MIKREPKRSDMCPECNLKGHVKHQCKENKKWKLLQKPHNKFKANNYDETSKSCQLLTGQNNSLLEPRVFCVARAKKMTVYWLALQLDDTQYARLCNIANCCTCHSLAICPLVTIHLESWTFKFWFLLWCLSLGHLFLPHAALDYDTTFVGGTMDTKEQIETWSQTRQKRTKTQTQTKTTTK